MSRGGPDDETFKILFESAPDAIYLNDLKGTFVDGNIAAEKLTGYKRKELIGKSFLKLKLLPKEQIPKATKSLVKSARGKPTGPAEFTLNRKDGTQVIVEIRTFPIKVEDKNLIMGIARDITERKRMERELVFLQEINETMVHGASIKEVFKAITDGLRVHFGYDVADIFTLKEDGKSLIWNTISAGKKIRKGLEKLTGMKGENLEIPISPSSNFHEIISKKKSILLLDIAKMFEDFTDKKTLKKLAPAAVKVTGFKSVVRAPLIVNKEVIGIIGVGSRQVLTENDVKILERLSHHLAVLISKVGAEDILKESERRFRDTLENANLIAVQLDKEGNITFANDYLLDLTGWEESEVLGKNWIDAFIPEDIQEDIKELHMLNISGKGKRLVKEFENEIITKDGKERLISWSNSHMLDPDSNIIGITTLGIDITERKRAKKELEESAIYLDTMPDVLSVTTPDGKIVRVNQVFYSMFGYEPGEVFGKNAVELFPERERPRLKEEAKNAIKSGKTIHFETVIETKNGEEMPVSLSQLALKDASGSVSGVITVLKDITLHKKAEGALKMAYNELKSLDTLKSDIIANVSHELRTPVTIVRGAIEMAIEEKNPSERKILLRMAMDALARQNSIIGDLIEATKLKEERALEINPVDLNDIAAIVSSEFEALLIKNKQTLDIDIEKGLPLVKADFEGLLHIMRNLVSNAVKFTGEGGKLGITARGKKGLVEVCVSDTVIGIPVDNREEVFERFYQVDTSSGRKYGGTGMGLAIVKEMVDKHGGEIWIESTEGKGSKFYFTLLTGIADL